MLPEAAPVGVTTIATKYINSKRITFVLRFQVEDKRGEEV